MARPPPSLPPFMCVYFSSLSLKDVFLFKLSFAKNSYDTVSVHERDVIIQQWKFYNLSSAVVLDGTAMKDVASFV